MLKDISRDSGNCRHVCMLPQEPKFHDLPPTADCYKYLLYHIREMMLPCEWHHSSFQYIRSQKSLQLERDRQVELGRWFIWHPYSAINYYWGCYMMLISYLTLMYIPVQVFYSCSNLYDPLILCSDGLMFLHILTRFITGHAHKDGKKVTLVPKMIAKQYIKGLFLADFISALPLQCIRIFKGDCKYPTHTVWFVFKLFRLATTRKQWHCFSKQLGLSYVANVTITVLLRIILFFHWMTYFLYQIPAFFANYYKENPKAAYWFKRLHVHDPNISVLQKYTANLYYLVGLCNGSGHFSPTDEFVVPELIFNSAIGIAGLIFLTYSFASLLRLAIYGRFEVLLYSGRLKQLTEYMIFKSLPQSLQHKIQLFINYKFCDHYFNEQAIFNTINEQIKQDINMHCCYKLVMNVPLFQDMPTALVNTIVFSLVQILYMPGETIIKCNQPGQSIYLIYSGTVAVINSSGREVAHLRDGSYFGESALLNPGVLRNCTVIALEISEIYKLTTKDFQACLQPYPHLKRRLEDSGSERKRRSRRTKADLAHRR